MVAVIDIGSNSVRLMLHNGEKSIVKFVESTKLAEGISEECKLSAIAIERTVKAILSFVSIARKRTENIMIFATEAVRRASNSESLLKEVAKETGIIIDVISGDLEARLGYVGVGQSGENAVIDIGGASTEIVIGTNGIISYAKSVRMGGVVLRDICGENIAKLDKYISDKIAEYGAMQKCKSVFAIGGTATTISALIYEIHPYDQSKVHGSLIEKVELINLIERIRKLSIEERRKVKGMFLGREDIIVCAMLALLKIMERMDIDRVIVSESDNLEGYLILKRSGEI